jgi:potassium efflux system protein
MENASEIFGQALALIQPLIDVAVGWLFSPAAWSQFALLAAAYVAAVHINRRAAPQLTYMLDPKDKRGLIAIARRFALPFLALLLPLTAYALTALGEQITRSIFGAGDVIAFGKRVFLLLAALVIVRNILTDSFLKLLGKYVLLPVAALYALGVLDLVTQQLESIMVELGNIQFSVMTLLRGAVSGALLFWLGSWSNHQSAAFIKSQPDLRPASRELAVKAAEVAIFGAAFLLLMSIMGIDLTAVAVLGGALGVGIGLGLQQIAANFVSGIILLVEGQTTVGDYVQLDGGEEGTIVKMTARACILETFDGKWIVVPNDHFITTRVVNYSDQGSANRYEVSFSVPYDCDVEAVPGIVASAVARLPFVLQAPEEPDVELRNFGESGIDFAVEYWVNGIDDGRNKYSSKVRFAVLGALKSAGISMPYPHRTVEIIKSAHV